MATVTAGYNWVSGETVTPTKLNSAAAPTVVVADGEVTTAKIVDANVTPAKLSQPLTLATAQNTTSGTSIDFTGIPSWAKRIAVMLSGVSTSGTSGVIIQLGTSSGIENTNYFSYTASIISPSSAAAGATTTGFSVGFGTSGAARNGCASLHLLTGNSWVYTGLFSDGSVTGVAQTAGAKATAATLDRVRLTTVNGTDTFDAGSVNIMYEG